MRVLINISLLSSYTPVNFILLHTFPTFKLCLAGKFVFTEPGLMAINTRIPVYLKLTIRLEKKLSTSSVRSSNRSIQNFILLRISRQQKYAEIYEENKYTYTQSALPMLSKCREICHSLTIPYSVLYQCLRHVLLVKATRAAHYHKKENTKYCGKNQTSIRRICLADESR